MEIGDGRVGETGCWCVVYGGNLDVSSASVCAFSDDFISGIILKYRLPTGEVIQSDHSVSFHKNEKLKTREDIYEWKSMSLDPEESIIHISFGYWNTGLMRFAIRTNLGRKWVVESKWADENLKTIDVNLADENKILAGMRTKVQDKFTDISIYVSELRKAKLDDMVSEVKNTVFIEPKVSRKKIKKKKPKKTVKRYVNNSEIKQI